MYSITYQFSSQRYETLEWHKVSTFYYPKPKAFWLMNNNYFNWTLRISNCKLYRITFTGEDILNFQLIIFWESKFLILLYQTEGINCASTSKIWHLLACMYRTVRAQGLWMSKWFASAFPEYTPVQITLTCLVSVNIMAYVGAMCLGHSKKLEISPCTLELFWHP